VAAYFVLIVIRLFPNALRELRGYNQSVVLNIRQRVSKLSSCAKGRWTPKFSFMLLAIPLLLPGSTRAAESCFALNQTSAGTSTASPGEDGVRELELGKPLESELTGGQRYSYQVTLASGQFLHAVVQPRAVGVSVTLFGPDSKPVITLAVPAGSAGPLFLVAKDQGIYRIEIRSPEGAATASYGVKIEELQVATSRDTDRALAQNAFAEGKQLHKEGTAASKQKAIEKYQQALPFWRAAGDQLGEAETLQGIALVYIDLSDAQKSLDYLNQALPIERAIGDRQGEAATLDARGSLYHLLGQNEKALDELNQALSLMQVVGNLAGEAETLRNIGDVHYQSGTWRKALDYYERGLSTAEAAGDRREKALALNSVGVGHNVLGDCRQALDYLDRALRLERALGDRDLEALTLYSISEAYDNLGDRQKTLDYVSQALPLSRAVGDRQGEAHILNNIGRAYDDLGEAEKALEYLNDALPLMRAVGDRSGEGYTVYNIGRVYDHLGRSQKALDYYGQALTLRRAVGNRFGESQSLTGIGRIYCALGDYQKAMDYLNQGLSLSRSAGNRFGEVFNLNEIGKVYLALGENEKGLDSYRQALPLAHALADRRAEANALYGSARAERNRGNLVEALAQIEAAIKIIESLRTEVLSQELRASYFATVQNNYALYIDVLMRLHQLHPGDGNEAKALEASERARARSLVETLAEAQSHIRQGADPVLLERERSLSQLLKGKESVQRKLLNGKHTEEQAAAIRKEITEILVQYEQVEGQVRATSPRYAALTQPQPLSAPEIQEHLDANTLLLEYALGDEHSYLWAVGPDSLQGFQLPKRSDAEATARRLYELLTARNRQLKGETEAQRRTRLEQAEAQYPQAAVALSGMLLGPVAPLLKRKRLVIVADGALQYIPFPALPEPLSDKNAMHRPTTANQAALTPLVVQHEIVSLPSASASAGLRREIKGRQPAPSVVAVLADPVFDARDPRVSRAFGTSESGVQRQSQKTGGTRGLEEKETTSPSDSLAEGRLTRSATEAGLGQGGELRFARLAFSRREAEDIVAAAPAGEGMMAVDFKANLQTATSPELARYRIVHFATHGLLNSERPELSGLVLSLVDQQGRPQDGFLQLEDIYNLNLPADLVVLSACETALGKEIRGEGLIGLTRGFMYAGARRVIASLWKVDDVATAELMKRLYHRMLTEGLPPAAALRQSQIEMWKQKRWDSPYYWAAFIIQGE
jgi:CHAT domain-containing protein